MEVRHEAERNRFVVATEAGEGELTYVRSGGEALDLVHTGVPRDARGEGVGDALVTAAFAHARDAGLRIIPSCPFVQEWVARHPTEEDLVSSG